jgi:hypothetical protein
MPDLFSEKVFGVSWSALAAVALVVAIAYVVIDTSRGTTGVTWVVLRWFHPACWLLLSVAALSMTRLTPLPGSLAGPIAAIGGLCYAIFAVMSLMAPKG